MLHTRSRCPGPGSALEHLGPSNQKSQTEKMKKVPGGLLGIMPDKGRGYNNRSSPPPPVYVRNRTWAISKIFVFPARSAGWISQECRASDRVSNNTRDPLRSPAHRSPSRRPTRPPPRAARGDESRRAEAPAECPPRRSNTDSRANHFPLAPASSYMHALPTALLLLNCVGDHLLYRRSFANHARCPETVRTTPCVENRLTWEATSRIRNWQLGAGGRRPLLCDPTPAEPAPAPSTSRSLEIGTYAPNQRKMDNTDRAPVNLATGLLWAHGWQDIRRPVASERLVPTLFLLSRPPRARPLLFGGTKNKIQHRPLAERNLSHG